MIERSPMRSTRRIPLRPLHLAGLLMIALATVLGFNGLQQSVRPYTTRIGEAAGSGRSVQLVGFLGSAGAYDDRGRFTFVLEDETGGRVTVISDEPRPSQFELATSVVAIGRYDRSGDVFVADELLIKCPSKYQSRRAPDERDDTAREHRPSCATGRHPV